MNVNALGAHAREGVLEVLDERGGLLVARAGHGVRAGRGGVRRGGGGDDEEGGALEEDDLGGAAGAGEGGEVLGEGGRVGDEGVHDAGPGLGGD